MNYAKKCFCSKILIAIVQLFSVDSCTLATRGMLSRGAHPWPWIDPRFGSLHYLTLEPMVALQGFMDRSNTEHPQTHMTSFSKMADCTLQEICFFVILLLFEHLTT